MTLYDLRADSKAKNCYTCMHSKCIGGLYICFWYGKDGTDIVKWEDVFSNSRPCYAYERSECNV